MRELVASGNSEKEYISQGIRKRNHYGGVRCGYRCFLMLLNSWYTCLTLHSSTSLDFIWDACTEEITITA